MTKEIYAESKITQIHNIPKTNSNDDKENKALVLKLSQQQETKCLIILNRASIADGPNFGSKHSQTDANPGHKSNPHIKLRDDGQHKGRDLLARRFRSN